METAQNTTAIEVVRKPLDLCVVEDDTVILETLTRILQSQGHNVHAYQSYEQLVNRATYGDPEHFDLGFYDFENKYGMNGNEFFNHVEEHKGRRVLMSGDVSNWQGYTGIRLPKPFTAQEIFMCLD